MKLFKKIKIWVKLNNNKKQKKKLDKLKIYK